MIVRKRRLTFTAFTHFILLRAFRNRKTTDAINLERGAPVCYYWCEIQESAEVIQIRSLSRKSIHRSIDVGRKIRTSWSLHHEKLYCRSMSLGASASTLCSTVLLRTRDREVRATCEKMTDFLKNFCHAFSESRSNLLSPNASPDTFTCTVELRCLLWSAGLNDTLFENYIN
jgi:hypothetical protein